MISPLLLSGELGYGDNGPRVLHGESAYVYELPDKGGGEGCLLPVRSNPSADFPGIRHWHILSIIGGAVLHICTALEARCGKREREREREVERVMGQ